MPPDVQIGISDNDEKEAVPKQIDMGIYDVVGFHDADLIQCNIIKISKMCRYFGRTSYRR